MKFPFRQSISWIVGSRIEAKDFMDKWWVDTWRDVIAGLILGLRPANERRRYKVTPSLIGWAQA